MKKLLWCDLETTGLSDRVHSILEIGLIVTDENLNILDSFSRAVYADEGQLCLMNEFVKKMHTDSHLIDEVKNARTRLEVEREAIDFVSLHFVDEKPILHGNSIHFDKRFIINHMPLLDSKLHFRLIDVSCISEMIKIYEPSLLDKNKTKHVSTHRVLSDLSDSIAQYSRLLNILKLTHKEKNND